MIQWDEFYPTVFEVQVATKYQEKKNKALISHNVKTALIE